MANAIVYPFKSFTHDSVNVRLWNSVSSYENDDEEKQISFCALVCLVEKTQLHCFFYYNKLESVGKYWQKRFCDYM
jgi:hypothetical protein